MSEAALNGSTRQKGSTDSPYHVSHETFTQPDAEATYGPRGG